MHGPVGHENRPGARVEESAPEAGCSFRASSRSSARVAGGQDHPIGVKFQGKDVLHGEKPITRRA